MTVPVRLLLVEDDSIDAARVHRILLQSAPQVELHHSVALGQALDRTAKQAFDGVLLDLHLPDSRGIETVTRLREVYDDVPLVVLTGSGEEGTAIGALHAGAQDYLLKDEITTGPLLMRTVRCAMDRKRLARDQRQRSERLAQGERTPALGVLGAGLALGFDRLMGALLGEVDQALGRLHAADEGILAGDLQAARKAALRAGRIVDRLCDHAITRSRALQPIDLSRFVLQASAFLDTLAGDRIATVYELPGRGPLVVADRLALYQLVVGLVTNAVEANRRARRADRRLRGGPRGRRGAPRAEPGGPARATRDPRVPARERRQLPERRVGCDLRRLLHSPSLEPGARAFGPPRDRAPALTRGSTWRACRARARPSPC